MHPAIILEAGVPALGLLGTLAAFFRSSGQREGRLSASIDENARAIKRLTDFLDRMDDKFDDHEHRITVLETKARIK